MRVKLIKCVQDSNGIHAPGEIIDLPFECAESLILRGLVEEAEPIIPAVVGLFGETVVPAVVAEVVPDVATAVAPEPVKQPKNKKQGQKPAKVSDLFDGDPFSKLPESARAKLLEEGIDSKEKLGAVSEEDLVCMMGFTVDEAKKTIQALKD
jgi:hypothetical protein